MPSGTESCSNPLVWAMTRTCFRWVGFSWGGAGREELWAATNMADMGKQSKRRVILAWRKRSPWRTFYETVWQKIRCGATTPVLVKVTQAGGFERCAREPTAPPLSLPFLGKLGPGRHW